MIKKFNQYNDMRKIAVEFEHPLDNLFIDTSERLCPVFKSMHFTPNGITFLSLIFGLIAIYSLWKGHITLFAISYLISHLFDCFDGHYARKYKMTSKFGDYFDHIKDVTVFVGIFIVFILKYKGCLRWYEWLLTTGIILIAAFGMLRQLGCQERHYGASHESGTLSAYMKLCPEQDVAKELRIRRWLGCGNMILTIILVVIVANQCK